MYYVLQGVVCDTRWSDDWADPRVVGASDFGRQGQRHRGWRLLPPEPPEHTLGLSSFGGGGGGGGGGSPPLSVFLFFTVLGSAGTVLGLYLAGMIGSGGGGGGRGGQRPQLKGAKNGRGGRLNKFE
jgi:hypothetical protein